MTQLFGDAFRKLTALDLGRWKRFSRQHLTQMAKADVIGVRNPSQMGLDKLPLFVRRHMRKAWD
nr:hypothetical protein [Rhodoferax sp. BAB1]